jgi:hypothetical protein
MESGSLIETTRRAPRRRERGRALGRVWWRGVAAGPLVALATVVAALITTQDAGVPLRDPDHVAALYLALVGFGMVLMVGLDVVLRAARRAGWQRPTRAAILDVRRERWTPARGLAVASALVSFYVSYMAYRNLKAIVPLLRPDAVFDGRLAALDRDLFLGHDPAALLHSVLGTGVTAHVLSAAYVAFIVFLPLSLAVALVYSRDIRDGLFYAAALSTNWIFGAGSYFLLPSLGPIYAQPGAFAHLPHSEVTRLQGVLLDQRVAFLHDPTSATPQAIAAFASLHFSMSLTAALAAHLLGVGRRLKIALWIWLALTTLATVYLGWHYVLDDAGGLVIALAALAVARGLTGIDLARARARFS